MDGKQNTKNSAYKLTLLHFIQILSVDYFHCWGHAVSLQPGRSRVRFPVLVVAQSSSEIPEGLMNNPVLCRVRLDKCAKKYTGFRVLSQSFFKNLCNLTV